MFGVSSLGTVSLEELRKAHDTPQVYQFYFYKDRGLNQALMQRAKDTCIEIMMLTVDSITGGNRERDLRTGFSMQIDRRSWEIPFLMMRHVVPRVSYLVITHDARRGRRPLAEQEVTSLEGCHLHSRCNRVVYSFRVTSQGPGTAGVAGLAVIRLSVSLAAMIAPCTQALDISYLCGSTVRRPSL